MFFETIPPTEVPNARKLDVEVRLRTTNGDFDRIMYAVYLKHRLACGEARSAFRETVVEFAESAVERARRSESDTESPVSISQVSDARRQCVDAPAWFALDAVDSLKQSELEASAAIRGTAIKRNAVPQPAQQ